MLVLLSLLLAPFLARFAGSQNAEILMWLELLRQKPQTGSRLADPQVRDALERYVVGRHGGTLRDEGFWRMAVMQGRLGEVRGLAADITTRHPAVSNDEMSTLSAIVAPEIARISRSRGRDQGTLAGAVAIIVTALTAAATALLLAAGAVSSLLVPGGIVTRLLGLAVITRDGREIRRWRSLARTAAAWLPAGVWLVYLAAGPKIQGWVPAPSMPLAGTSLALGLMAVGALWTIARPTRGPHDWVTGTWVTPR
jgi:RDD family